MFGEAQISVVFTQLQPIFRTRREHSIRFRNASRDEIVDQHAEIGFIASRAPALVADRKPRRVDPGEDPLRRRFFVARRAVDLSREK